MNNSAEKIVVIVTPYFPPYGGGLERYAFEIAQRLHNDCQWKVVVITSGERYGVDAKEEINRLTVYRLAYKLKISNTPFSFKWFGKIRGILNKENPDIINIHTPVPGIGDITAMLAKNKPMIVTYHASSMRKGELLPDIFIWIYEHLLLKKLLNRAKHIVCASDFVRFNFLGKYQYKSSTITPAVNTDIFKPAPEKKNKYPSILFVAGLGRAEKNKGLHILIDAIKLLHKKVPDLQLVVVGGGDMRGEYERYVQQIGLQENVTFKGRLDTAELVPEFQQSDIFVLPSLTPAESFGMVLIEAMACGKPVIGSISGGIPLVIDHEKTGLLVESGNAQALAFAIKRLLDDPVFARQLSVAGLDKARTKYNWNIQTGKYDEIFKNIYKNKRKPCIIQIASYYPPHLGGLERVAQEISGQLAEDGHSVTVLTSNLGGKNLPRLETKSNLVINRLWSFEFAHVAFIPGMLWQLLRVQKPAILHLHLAQAYVPERVWLVAKLKRIPYVVHFHGDIGKSGRLGFIFLLWKFIIQRMVINGAAMVITLSPNQSKLIQERYHKPASQISFISNGVGEQFLEIGKEKRIFHKPLRLLFVGRLSVQKRSERLIEALSLVKSDVALDIVGDGEDRAKLESLVAKLGLSNIRFCGRLDGEKLLDAYRNADVFILPSDWEGMPLVILEAMATGLPIIGSDVLGISELIEGVGILVKDPSPNNFAKAIDELARNPDRLKQLSLASFEKAQQYSWKKIIKKLEAVYKEILK